MGFTTVKVNDELLEGSNCLLQLCMPCNTLKNDFIIKTHFDNLISSSHTVFNELLVNNIISCLALPGKFHYFPYFIDEVTEVIRMLIFHGFCEVEYSFIFEKIL